LKKAILLTGETGFKGNQSHHFTFIQDILEGIWRM